MVKVKPPEGCNECFVLWLFQQIVVESSWGFKGKCFLFFFTLLRSLHNWGVTLMGSRSVHKCTLSVSCGTRPQSWTSFPEGHWPAWSGCAAESRLGLIGIDYLRTPLKLCDVGCWIELNWAKLMKWLLFMDFVFGFLHVLPCGLFNVFTLWINLCAWFPWLSPLSCTSILYSPLPCFCSLVFCLSMLISFIIFISFGFCFLYFIAYCK